MSRRSSSFGPGCRTAWRIRRAAGPDLALKFLEGRAAEAAPAAPPTPVSAATGSLPTDQERALFQQLANAFAQAGPSLPAHDRAQVGQLFARVEPLLPKGGLTRGPAEVLSAGGSLQRLIRQGEHLVRNTGQAVPGGDAPQPRPTRVLAALAELKLAVLRQGLRRPAAAASQNVATDLFTRLGHLTFQWQGEDDTGDAFALVERDQARPLAMDVFEFLCAGHAHEVRPVWPGEVPPRDANTVFFSGCSEMHAVVQRVARGLGLQVDPVSTSASDFAPQRWRGLRRAAVAAFDLGSAAPQVYYELGMALATGVQLLLMAPRAAVLPFDVAQSVMRYDSLTDLEARLPQALDDACYRVQACAPPDVGGDDALLMKELLRLGASVGGADVLSGRWFPQPMSASPRWFAVMPFRAGPDARWRHMVGRLRKLSPGLEPVRGDRALGQEIIASIWDELCRATHVTVDLTGFNPNVCLEAGIAHALGRPTLLIGEAGTARRLGAELPGLAKWRCHEYGAGLGRPFNTAVGRFFTAS